MLWRAVFGGCCRWPIARRRSRAFPTPSRRARRICWRTPDRVPLIVGDLLVGTGLGGLRSGDETAFECRCGVLVGRNRGLAHARGGVGDLRPEGVLRVQLSTSSSIADRAPAG